MDILKKIKGWAAGLTDLGLSIVALLLVVEVLGLGAIPFFPETSVVTNVAAMLGTLGSEGLMGLVAIWILWGIWSKK